MRYCNYCGKEIDESNVYGNGIFCNKVCQIRKNSKAAVDAARKVAESKKIELTCMACGTTFKVKPSQSKRKFCSLKCSTTFTGNKSHPKSEESKLKTSRTLKARYKSQPKSPQIKSPQIKQPKSSQIKSKCKSCGKPSFKRIYKHGLCADCLRHTAEGKAIMSSNSKMGQIRLIQEGKHKSWIPRNKRSYPERFWEGILESNHISYESEFRVVSPTTWYSLDFLIRKGDKLIDLEIDGSQHNWAESKLHDNKRDEELQKLGYKVYRVKWNPITKEGGKNLMQVKIQQFISFYESL